MAVTKTHPIKSTMKAAIDYICNPDKTDGNLLVSSFGCTAETADIEFAWTRRHAIDKGTNLGRHLIQAFEPGEVTPEEAHRIGMELAREVLGGKYEFVLTTHTDRDHIHNHLIFNAVSFTDHKHYHSNKRSYHEIRRTSDRICKEHGLSVIVPGRDKGKSYIEHQAAQNGTSYKAKLKAAIDRLLPGCTDLEDLLRRLQREGYELKRGKYISVRAPGQERFTRFKTLGAVRFSRYNGGRNGGAANDENRGHQRIFQEVSFARCHRRATVLHFQIGLHQEMESWILSGSGCSAACPSASIGCVSGLFRAAAPWVAAPCCLR